MTRGRTSRGRARAEARRVDLRRAALPLLQGVDHGDPIVLGPQDVGEATDSTRWIEPFLAANADALRRLALTCEARAGLRGVRLELHPHSELGAVPLRAPSSRRVTAGLLVAPRFGWTSVGQVLGGVGFRVEPQVGGGPLVPGSAREVPPWVLAGPVLARLAALIRRLTRTFVETRELRRSPRGRVDWGEYARHQLPTGRWDRLPCRFPDLVDDPWTGAILRWTLRRLGQDLATSADEVVGRRLLEEVRSLLQRLGPGPFHRPGTEELRRALGDSLGSAWFTAALEAVGWVTEERGLGGARTLDGLPWSLAVDRLWESWVEAVLHDVAARTGARLEAGRTGATVRPLAWRSGPRTMGSLVPDFAVRLPGRVAWVDAKYKGHLADTRYFGWHGLSEREREAHRADLHQALAYASLSEESIVSTVLAYPVPSGEDLPEPGVAEVLRGERRVRLLLVGVPFGFRGPEERERVLRRWEDLLRPN